MPPFTAPKILVVEDNPADVLTLNAAFSRLNYQLQTHFVADGQMALDYLTGKRPYGDRAVYPLPNLILLDLGLPKLNGYHVLEWVRTHPDLRFIPIIILSTSNLYADIQRAYTFGANSFIIKPPDLNKLVQDLKTALDFWLFAANRSVPNPQPALASDTPPHSAGAA